MLAHTLVDAPARAQVRAYRLYEPLSSELVRISLARTHGLVLPPIGAYTRWCLHALVLTPVGARTRWLPLARPRSRSRSVVIVLCSGLASVVTKQSSR